MNVSEKFAVLIPTYNRPEKMRDLLSSIAEQSILPERVLVVASGEDIRGVVESFSSCLRVEYFYSEVGGQIHQRNIGIHKLDESIELVASFDDDIVLEQDAIENILSFWNEAPPETAGVSFNIINAPPYKFSRLLALACMSSPRQGAVLRSGYNTAGSPTTQDIKTQWLCGGATVWRSKVLKDNLHQPVNSRWAICEDLIFSYPLGKIYPLFVCASARVRHEHVYDHARKIKHFYYGYTSTLWRFHFEEMHVEISRVAFVWMTFCQITTRFFAGVLKLRVEYLQYATGQFAALLRGGIALATRRGLISLVNE